MQVETIHCARTIVIPLVVNRKDIKLFRKIYSFIEKCNEVEKILFYEDLLKTSSMTNILVY